ncbi:HD-GYP domain-containing protein [Brevibacillus massiliensis]|jgi:HD-GYP domain-containing protein (c-di-GMP phosphodiesterase class II)|uniref:HD-GYP domain-containing protein n=1 Tax=Brevibacillus massiliensis TaxID=1118054 RepID=UPI000317DE76|nr:HD-GYP domain-containing protein [Brevibacillus massiliensis]
MRLVSLKKATPGMKLGRTVFTEDGKVLLGTGMVLNERLIQGLEKAGVDSIYIDDPRTADIEIEDVIRPETRQAAVEVVQKTIKQIQNTNRLARRISVKDMGMHFQQVFHAILDDLMGSEEIVVHLANISSRSSAMYHHAVNVSVLATAVGMSLGYNRKQLTELGIGAMLHDIGKIDLPKELLDKRERWTPEEFEISKQHTRYGFDILRKQHDLSLLSAHVALSHHERLDGSGYPQGLKGDQIHEYAQITAICDVYDSLTTPRPWRRRYMPQDALEYLQGSGGHLFEHHLVSAFCRHIAIFPLGSSIVLNTGEAGVVCRVDPNYSHRPVIRVLKDGRGNDISMPYEIDLKSELKYFIVGFEDESLFVVPETKEVQ